MVHGTSRVERAARVAAHRGAAQGVVRAVVQSARFARVHEFVGGGGKLGSARYGDPLCSCVEAAGSGGDAATKVSQRGGAEWAGHAGGCGGTCSDGRGAAT